MEKKFIFILIAMAVVILILLFSILPIFLSLEDNDLNNANFTIIVLPDTQKYSEHYPEIFSNQTQWIVDNKEKLNIKFVIHEGDIVDESDDIQQWQVANESMYILDKNSIPYSVVSGNHDKSEFYNLYFPVLRFSDEKWWGGNYKNNENNFQLITIEKQDFLFINLDFCPENEEIEWANSIIENYSNRKAILTTHAYLNEKAERETHVCGSTEYIWQNLIRKHENLQLVLSGHVHAEARRTDKNLAGKKVHQILANYQDEENGGNGWLRIIEFFPLEDKIYVKTYSPYLNSYKTVEKSQFILDYEI